MKVLIIDHNREIIGSLRKATEYLQVELLSVGQADEGIRICQEEGCDIVMLRDSTFPSASAETLQTLRNCSAMPEVVIYAEEGDSLHAEQALLGGAWDYVVGRHPEKIMAQLLHRVVRYRRNNNQEQGHELVNFKRLLEQEIIGSSAVLQNCLNLVTQVALSDASVLITGATGTGKELFAQAIHNISQRSNKRFTVIDCAALPSTLVESILFGHAKGSFTGADTTRKGLIKQADGGTLFLDEIGEMPLEIQKKFLRVLQEQEYLPVGSNTREKSNFRLVAATNRNLEKMVEEGTFRADLLFRLKTFELELPPLKERKADIAELTYHFRNRFLKKYKLKKKKTSTDYMLLLNQYDWPGNVRELAQAVEYSITSARDSLVLESAHLPVNIRLAVTQKKLKAQNSTTSPLAQDGLPVQLDAMPTLRQAREEATLSCERRYLTHLLELTGRDIRKCCAAAALSRSRLYDLLKKHNLLQRNSTSHDTSLQ